MKRVRITYQGAFHHGMNRGINGEDIFSGSKNKTQFLDGYTLLNPIRVGIVADFNNYIWSSCSDYFSNETSAIVDSDFVNELVF
jgi:hypothetical protein